VFLTKNEVLYPKSRTQNFREEHLGKWPFGRSRRWVVRRRGGGNWLRITFNISGVVPLGSANTDLVCQSLGKPSMRHSTAAVLSLWPFSP
jgi:hypothetical protein